MNTFKEFSEACNQTWRGVPDGVDSVLYLALAINEEAGEVAGHVKKMYRDDGEMTNGLFLTPERRQAILKEMGDVLYYLDMLADDLGSSLAEVADINVEKLVSRHARGVIGGEGDDR